MLEFLLVTGTYTSSPNWYRYLSPLKPVYKEGIMDILKKV
ncbi:hypothetical protein KIS1582_4260 [Cytobacillus firmus]|uniref:Uncharacterized protein n=1 Tax=Cytobacillus firmus TaxID=1399 RepID=A0A800MT59_CYTFI|nr:hypothetical protein KIS1582_4260 [Cytobacillus firmus]